MSDTSDLSQRRERLTPEQRRLLQSRLRGGANEARVMADAIPRRDPSVRVPLSSAQQSLWLTWKLDPASPAYNMPGALHLRGRLDVAALERTLQALVARHEILRTVYTEGADGQPEQWISPGADLALPRVELRGQSAALSECLKAFAQAPFGLDQSPPFRATLVQLGDDEHVLAVALHHIAGDGWSIRVLVDELFAIYEAFVAGREMPLADLPIQFADLAVWQRRRLDEGEHQRQIAHWRARLDPDQAPLALPLDRPRGSGRDSAEARHAFALSGDLSERLRQLARSEGVSLYVVMLSLLKLTLYRFTGQRDLQVGTPLANRQKAETHGLIGYLLNVQVLRTVLAPSQGFGALLRQVRDTVLDAQAHHDVPFDALVDALQPERQAGVHPLFQVKCTQIDDMPAMRSVAGLSVRLEELSGGHAHFDLSFDFTDGQEGIRGVLVYADALFDPPTVGRMALALQALARQVVLDATRPLTELVLPDETLAVLAGPVVHCEEADVVARWADAACRVPDRLAVRHEDIAFSFRELDGQAERLAGELVTLGVGPEVRVGVHAERSCEFVLGVLAVLKAGGAYVPLDAQLPSDRLAYQLGDSGARVLLTTKPQPWQAQVKALPLAFQQGQARTESPARSAVPVHRQQTAYVIYTSGSTGQPKGVLVSRGALANYVQAVLDRLALSTEATSMAMVSTVAADLGHTTFFGALCSGRSLHLINTERAFDPDRFASYMVAHEVDVLKIVPSHLRALLQAARPQDVLPRHVLVVGGEATHWPLVDRVRELKPSCRLLNHYGPTESTVGVLTQDAEGANRQAPILPLGRPLANVQAMVRDGEGHPLPQGVAGELWLAGAGVALGYLGRPAQTAERFVPNPDPARPGERLYRTGDRARLLADGSLEFLGRADDQVKIRGYRVELGEVRASLLACEGVVDAAVVVHASDDGRSLLHAYAVGGPGVALDAAALRTRLAEHLPDYMVPAAIVVLEVLPLTANGKLDRRALPLPGAEAAKVYAAPQGEAESILAAVWAEVLRLDRVGRDDNFFELGGDSILTLQVVARSRKRGLKLSPKHMMELQTVARIIAAQAPDVAPVAALVKEPAEEGGEVALTPVQRWFFSQDLPECHHWNQSVLLQVGTPLDETRLRESLHHVVAHHDALALMFAPSQGRWSACLRPRRDEAWLLSRIVLSGETDLAQAIARTCDQAQRTLNLTEGPLLRAVWMDMGPSRPGRLLLVAHHLVIDVVSWRVLLEDLQSCYESGPGALPDRSTSYARWARQLQAYADSPTCRGQIAHWQEADRPDASWPVRDNAGPNTVASMRTVRVALTGAQTEQLLRPCVRAYRTRVDELLLSALTRCLCDWSGLDSVRIELEGHGREDLFEDVDLSRTIGWFTTLYPVRLKPASDLRSTILSIKEQLRQVPGRGLGYGVLRHLGEGGHGLDGPSPYLTFNYLGQLDAQQQGAWTLAPEPPGEERAGSGPRRAWFEVIAKVQNGCLLIDWHYSANLHDDHEVQALATRHAQCLGEVIEHCLHDDAGGLSPSDIPLATLTQAQVDGLKLDTARGVADVYPLAPMQQGLLLHTLLNAGAGMYLMQDHYRFAAELDVDAFTRAWDSVVQRHEALRTGFVWHGDETQLQVVHRQVPSPVQFFDGRELGEAVAMQRLDDALKQELAEGFDLASPPLMRLRLVRLSDREFHLVQSFHHILMDAWCRSLLLTDFFAHYEAYRAGQEIARPLPRPYRDFIAWLQRQDRDAARTYWREVLKGFDTATPLPWRKERANAGEKASVIDLVTRLSEQETSTLQRLAQHGKLTLNTVVQGAWALLLARLGSQHEVLFGVTVAGRPLELEGIQDTVGLFINTIPLRVSLPAEHTPVLTWLQSLQLQNLTMRQHEHLPLVEIQALGEMPRGRSLFDSLFVFENAPMDESLQAQERALGITTIGNRTHTNYPLTVVVIPGRQLWLQLSCDGRVFEELDMARLLDGFKELIVQLIAHPEARLADLGLLPTPAKAALLTQGEGPAVAHPFQPGFAALFEAQARQHADRLAARATGQAATYAELNREANRAAHALRKHGVGPDDVVALCVDRGLPLLSLVLGTFKAGGAYLAVDGAVPGQRLAAMLVSSRARVVVASAARAPAVEALLAGLSDPPRLVVHESMALEGRPEHNPDLAVRPDQAAYVIYTSGSTGEPKGVVVTQQGMLNNQLSKIPYLGLGPDDVIAQTASPSFDISVWQLLTGLLCGACVDIVADETARDPAALLAQVRAGGITVLQSVPALIQGMLAAPPMALPSLRWMLPTGEASTVAMARQWFERYPAVPLINAYGPAECADDVSLYRLDAVPESLGSHYLPIGRPTDNTRLCVLDARLEPLPAGVSGELYVAGIGVGRGYLNRPGLTAERFLPDPHAARPGERLYRTGDIARYRDDGVLEYLGRADQQVKIRGFRIELGEIEAQIALLDEVAAAAVAVHADALGTPQLVGYVVPRDADLATAQEGLWRDQLRAHLGGILPEYMVPALWVAMPRLPLTPNGKLDRKALPAPDIAQLQAAYEPPQGEIEEAVAAVWSEVLGVPRIGRRDGFFEMGGHSLLAMQVIARLQTRLSIEVPLGALFEAQTLDQFAARLAAIRPHGGEQALQALDAFLDSLEEV